MSRKMISLEAYSIHGILDAGFGAEQKNADYDGFFSDIDSFANYDSSYENLNERVFIDRVEKIMHDNHSVYAMRFILVDISSAPEVYDLKRDEAYEMSLGENELPVTASTWGFFVNGSRTVLLQRSRPVVPKMLIETYLGQCLQQYSGSKTAKVNLNPHAAASFYDQVMQLERIRKVAIVLKRPNSDWLDAAGHIIDAAHESNAGVVELEARAERMQSLRMEQGIVREALEIAQSANPAVANIKITGKKSNEPKEKTISLSKHIFRIVLEIDSNAAEDQMLKQAATGAIGCVKELASRKLEA